MVSGWRIIKKSYSKTKGCYKTAFCFLKNYYVNYITNAIAQPCNRLRYGLKT